MTQDCKIAIVGSYPPPYGGVSIHIQRMHYSLVDRQIKHIIYTTMCEQDPNLISVENYKWWFIKYCFFAKEDTIHFHVSGWKEMVLVGLMGLAGRKVVLTIHGESLRQQINQINWLSKLLLTFSLQNITKIIAVNENIKNFLLSLSINPGRLEQIPAFLPPIVKKEDIAEIPDSAWDFMATHTPIISANAYKISFHNEVDLYGIDMCIELCTRLKNFYPKVGFVFALPDIGDHEYYSKLIKIIGANKIDHNFLFQHKPCQFYPILAKSDVFVRPTNTDGDAVSIREALFFNVPTVASNVVPRPEGTVLFETRDNGDLFNKVKDILDKYESYKKKLQSVKMKDNFEEILAVYRSMTSK